ncbi:MAG: ATP phosphoribosyltransferase (ATP-PRTase) (ATP-PRT) [Vezdaea aestivalis]|nr:MAG: ATP phosphoribosyltransferase (ATP-PRTase) (ATP-PRT) [Vezdaea aestivalis]
MIFAVPKSEQFREGRLYVTVVNLLKSANIKFRRSDRSDIAHVVDLDLYLVFLNSSDIPLVVSEGSVDLGITGRDCILEFEAAELPPGDQLKGIEEILDLGFGQCSLQVQVPKSGKIQTPQDLVGRTVITSFPNLTRAYMRKLEGKSADKTNTIETHVRYMAGSVEASYALGISDAVVDLVETGDTMVAAGLKAIDTVAKSSCILIGSKRTSEGERAELIAKVIRRIEGIVAAQKFVLCQYNVHRSQLEQATKITPGKRAPTITSLVEDQWVGVSSMVEKSLIADKMEQLKEIKAQDILVLKIENYSM